MATTPAQRAAVMSIHPQYAVAIMSGEKRVEFRKRRLASDVSTVWVYATAPTQRIIGCFRIAEVVELSPRQMWHRYGRYGCISKKAFDEYYRHHSVAIGIVVGSVEALDRPLPLDEILPSGVPPQSFAYVTEKISATV